ncbi:hypothetical protein A2774_01245 [Candidatus Roizmanbacteria bacterium RIFCSPHIGHO2_01_FULL_39_12c]|uniref:Uncharacterized protein n=1 Tax=Candidatus Roizmanbacteria bacterium RIFCSPHIGHO2_01_FULL_39_12c TaxID=1802031 RepID=A0A1F7GDV6_9BACT|nr:MAG: hypothetical protein A2774_01245 [Candidatus Roizmanbacteria bacterium RIFCSPHIGHO2_01_FULL_39_12c]
MQVERRLSFGQEIRISKSEIINKFKILITKFKTNIVLNFENFNLVFVSNLEFSISSFSTGGRA